MDPPGRRAHIHAGHDPQVLLTHYAAAMPTDVSGVAIALESVTAPGVVHAGAVGGCRIAQWDR